MSDFTIHTTATAPEAARPPLAALEQAVGFVPNLAGTIAGSPAALDGFVKLRGALHAGGLSPVELEVVGVAVSHANACPYSITVHSAFAARAGADAATVAALRAGGPLPDPRLDALRAFAAAVVEARGHVGAEALVDAGFTPAQVLEAIAQIAYTTFANLVANVTDTPVDDAFAQASVT